MKRRNICSSLELIDDFTESEKEMIKGGKVNVKGSVTVEVKGTKGTIEISNLTEPV